METIEQETMYVQLEYDRLWAMKDSRMRLREASQFVRLALDTEKIIVMSNDPHKDCYLAIVHRLAVTVAKQILGIKDQNPWDQP